MDRNSIPVLMYHALDEQRSVISISSSLFAWQMQWLHQKGYRTVSLGALVDALSGREPLPSRTIAITFDDGFESTYTQAFPILARYGFSATVFLVSDYCGKCNDWPGQPASVPRRPLMTWEQVGEMDRHGIEFGAHTVSHPRLDRLSDREAEREILTSKATLEERLGHAVQFFAYPYGRYNGASKALVGRAYSGACGTRLGLVSSESDPLALERVEVHYLERPFLFRRMSSPLLHLYFSLRRPLRTVASALLSRPWG